MAECQSAWMSKITNDCLTWSGTGCFIAGNSRCQRVLCTDSTNQSRETIYMCKSNSKNAQSVSLTNCYPTCL